MLLSQRSARNAMLLLHRSACNAMLPSHRSARNGQIMCCLCSIATKDLPQRLHSKATTATRHRSSVVHRMSAASPVHTSWADAMDDEETLWATGSASTVADAFVEPAVSVQPAVSTELPLAHCGWRRRAARHRRRTRVRG